jgi:hypothetical protein
MPFVLDWTAGNRVAVSAPASRRALITRVDSAWHQPNSIGNLVGPLMPSSGFHGAPG